MNISKVVSANLSSFWYEIDPSPTRAGESYKGGIADHLNLIWSPIEHFTTGIEFMYLKRVNTNSMSGEGRRIQVMFKYTF